jgi:RNA polymerase sigma factor (sigma-70 family)
LSTLFDVGVVGDLTDGQLLERFATGPSHVAERAFEALVDRHGAMVLRVCRARLRDWDETQDAFQAVFLILIKKARSLWVKDSIGPWLHQVAVRTAGCARGTAARRRRIEERVGRLAGTVCDGDAAELSDGWEEVLHEEINRLPERYRVPIILCDLQGGSCEEVARRMGRPVGTVKSWRARGRERLRSRLIRRGLAPSAAVVMGLCAGSARAVLCEPTVHLAVRMLVEVVASGKVSASVKLLVKGVIQAMLLGKLQMVGVGVLAAGVMVSGVVGAGFGVGDDLKGKEKGGDGAAASRPGLREAERIMAKPEGATESWPMTLREAIHIALDGNSGRLRVISIGKPTKIAAVQADEDMHRFKSEVMAEIRSVEQQYWGLAQAIVQLVAAQKVAAYAKEILEREQADLKAGRGTVADVAEAAQRVEQFNLDVVTRTSDRITTERQLRNLLGLPAADNRMIVPVTLPTEGKLEPDWDRTVALALANNPEIVRAKQRIEQAKADKAGDESSRLENVRIAEETFKVVVNKETHGLARFFLEIDANYKQFRTAARLRKAAADRLSEQRAYYEEGRITLDRLLDAASQLSTAVATESQYKTTYNIAIAAFEEAKGTLLFHDNIMIVDSAGGGEVVPREAPVAPAPARAVAAAGVAGVSDRRVDGAVVPASAPVVEAGGRGGKSGDADARTVSFDLTVGPKGAPFVIRGSFTISGGVKGD